MPKYGQLHFNEGYFSGTNLAKGDYKRSIHRVPLGTYVRGSIRNEVTFRVRHGNGVAGATLGKVYQDKFRYNVPGNINNSESEPWRVQWRAAVDHWQNVLTAAEIAEYNERATKGLRMSGYNLFIREAMNGDYSMFTDRGDPAGYDFTEATLTEDDAWHELDLSSIVPTVARAILLDLDFTNAQANKHLKFRENGNTNDFNHSEIHTRVAAQDDHGLVIVAPDVNAVIEYNITAGGWSAIGLTVRGWWT